MVHDQYAQRRELNEEYGSNQPNKDPGSVSSLGTVIIVATAIIISVSAVSFAVAAAVTITISGRRIFTLSFHTATVVIVVFTISATVAFVDLALFGH
jgi:hypothetical protein